jgi:cytochrome c551/c552
MITKTALISAVLLISTTLLAAPTPEEGKTIFTARCAGCHNINKTLTGPALAGIDQRRSMEWIVDFVHSSQTLVKNGDKDAVALYEQFNRIPMPDHPDLTEDNIKSIVEYIKSEGNNAAKGAVVVTEAEKPSLSYSTFMTPGIVLTFVGLLALLITTILFAIKVKGLMREHLKQKA